MEGAGVGLAPRGHRVGARVELAPRTAGRWASGFGSGATVASPTSGSPRPRPSRRPPPRPGPDPATYPSDAGPAVRRRQLVVEVRHQVVGVAASPIRSRSSIGVMETSMVSESREASRERARKRCCFTVEVETPRW